MVTGTVAFDTYFFLWPSALAEEARRNGESEDEQKSVTNVWRLGLCLRQDNAPGRVGRRVVGDTSAATQPAQVPGTCYMPTLACQPPAASSPQVNITRRAVECHGMRVA